uniref:Transcription elongation factor B polypeptide 2-like n=1 Tax=Phallusia mammillata TaxID=59560 RepID=A0A6F9DTT9_9ASCI|nr:transcription elongation factor B polypeptide 2-like [Phallusia mammillata]
MKPHDGAGTGDQKK